MSEIRRSALTKVTKVAARLRDLLWASQGGPALERGEEVILKGVVVFWWSVMGGRSGELILTNRRLIWYERIVARPFKPIYGEVRLSDVEAVDKGTLFDLLGGHRRLRLHLRGGRRKKLAAQGRLDEWVAAIRSAIASRN
jgi:hypothetical protein